MVIKLIPVCECGHIFSDGIYCTNEEHEEGPITYCEQFFDPPICPECGEPIEGVEYRSMKRPSRTEGERAVSQNRRSKDEYGYIR